MTDAELLTEALAGSENSFTALYRRRQSGVYRFALQMTGSVAIAEDVTQETFLALLKHGSRYDAGKGTVASFLFGIARNHVLKRVERHEMGALEEVELAEPSAGALESMTRQQTIDQVRRAVLSLPAQYREAVVLCDLQEASYDDAAAILECPVGTVRSRLSRGRAMLEQKLRGTAVEAAGSLP